MKMNEVMPDLDQAMDTPNNIKTPKKPQGSMSPSQARQRRKPGQQGQQGQQRQQQGQQRQQQGQQQTDQDLRPGKTVKLPTDQGDDQNFKVIRDMGDEVEIENPEGNKSPSQPNKLVYKKSDLEKVIRNRK
jgi:hypothetical protein